MYVPAITDGQASKPSSFIYLKNFKKAFVPPIEALTYGFIGDKRLVIKAKDLGDIVEIGMLCHECPL
ncbi:hypothetical protein CFP56_012989 [Quercus suber]|uniref:Uncharacterized protein n=1 Tax=Quercus suber TaxID=58331 RepID=A0AAW0KWE1_QUESU